MSDGQHQRVPLSTIGESTPITIGLVVMLAGMIFALGVGYNKLDSERETNQRQGILIEQQSVLIQQMARRLDIIETSRAYEQRARERAAEQAH